jgi:hypothetical protein
VTVPIDLDVAAVIDREVVADATGTVGRVVETIGVVASRTGVLARNLSPLATALFPHQPHLTSGRDDLIDRYRATWLARARSGGLTDSVAHLELATYPET